MLAQALQEKVFNHLHSLFTNTYCSSLPLDFFFSFLVFLHFIDNHAVFSGCYIIAFITAGGKTFIREECAFSSSKESRRTSEELVAGKFLWHPCFKCQSIERSQHGAVNLEFFFS